MRKISFALAAGLILAPLATQAQPANSNTATTSADARQVYNATLYQGKLTVDAINALGVKIDALTAAIKAGGTPSTGGSGTTTPPPPTDTGTGTTPPPPSGAMPAMIGVVDDTAKTITLKSGIEPADAVNFFKSGYTVIAQPGNFLKTFGLVAPLDNITLKCATPGKCVIDGQGGNGAGHRLMWGKACIIVSDMSATIQGFAFKHCGSPLGGNSYSNESGIYFDGGAIDKTKLATAVLTINQNLFDGNANAIFGAGMAGGKIVITGNIFGLKEPNGLNGAVNGSANGPAHDMYIQLGQTGSLEVAANYFYGSAGHNVKARIGYANVHDNLVMTYDGGRVVDMSDGGKLDFTNNAVWNRDDSIFPARTLPTNAYSAAWSMKAGTLGNSNVLATGDESVGMGAPSGIINDNKFNISRTGSTIWVNTAGGMSASGNSLSFYGAGSLNIQGLVTGLAGASAPPGAPAHAPAPPAPPAWATN